MSLLRSEGDGEHAGADMGGAPAGATHASANAAALPWARWIEGTTPGGADPGEAASNRQQEAAETLVARFGAALPQPGH